MFLFERKFNSKARDKAASSGAAMKDGSFPIYNRKDLKNAIKLAGHSKHGKAAAMAHIRKRAKALGLSMNESIQKIDESITNLVISLYEEDPPSKESLAIRKLMLGTFGKPVKPPEERMVKPDPTSVLDKIKAEVAARKTPEQPATK